MIYYVLIYFQIIQVYMTTLSKLKVEQNILNQLKIWLVVVHLDNFISWNLEYVWIQSIVIKTL